MFKDCCNTSKFELTDIYKFNNEPCSSKAADNLEFAPEEENYCKIYEYDSTDLTCSDGVDCTKSQSTMLSIGTGGKIKTNDERSYVFTG